MMRPRTSLPLLAGVALLSALPACDLAAMPEEGEQVPALNIPTPKPPRPPLAPELAALVYPDAQASRDPFLTGSEQARIDGHELEPTPTPDPSPSTGKPVVRTARYDKEKVVIQQLREEVNNIVLGSRRNTFLFHGRYYEEGDVIESSNWVVVSITESGIRLRTKNGTGTSFLKFSRDPSLPFEFGTR